MEYKEDLIGTDISDGSLIKNSDTTTFASDVIEASKKTPVIVDFWAEWCEPCKTLGPILESVVKSFKGGVKLVKVDIEKNQELAQQLRIQSIPTIYAFFQGQPIDGFSGALAENEVKDFINKVVKNSGGEDKNKQIEELLENAEKKLSQNENETALDLYSNLLSIDSKNPKIIAGYGKCLINLGRPDEVEELVNSLEEEVLKNNSIQNLLSSLKLLKENKNAEDPDKFEKKIETNPNDHEARFNLASALLAKGEKDNAVDHLLEIVEKDRKWQDDKARKKILEILNANSEDNAFVSAVRQKLSNILFK